MPDPVRCFSRRDLRLCRPVVTVLLENVSELMLVWQRWFPGRKPIKVEAELTTEAESVVPSPKRAAALFSGGVDSFFTVIRHDEPNLAFRTPVSDLLCVRGFDIPFSKPEAFQLLLERLQRASESLNKNLVVISTNLRECMDVVSGASPAYNRRRFQKSEWPDFYDMNALASVGLLFENRFSDILIASSFAYDELSMHGVNPLTAPLLSTAQTRIRHDGGGFNRTEKTVHIADSVAVQRSLHVCYSDGRGDNCGVCSKCCRTMLALEAAGKLEAFTVFDQKKVNLEKLPSLFLGEHRGEYVYFEEILQFAEEQGRKDIAEAVKQCLLMSRRKAKFLLLVRWLVKQKGLWRLRKPIVNRWYGARLH